MADDNGWYRYHPKTDDYTDNAAALWLYDYRMTDGDIDRVGNYQVIVFHDEPGRFYVRPIPREVYGKGQMCDFTKASCMDRSYDVLEDAQAVAEMLERSSA